MCQMSRKDLEMRRYARKLNNAERAFSPRLLGENLIFPPLKNTSIRITNENDIRRTRANNKLHTMYIDIITGIQIRELECLRYVNRTV